MNNREFAIIADVIKSAYPSSKIMGTKSAFNLWYRMLKDIDYQTASAAVENYIATNVFAPSIAQVREACLTASQGEQALWDEEWENVCTAISKYGYMRKEEALASLEPLTAEVVKHLGWLSLCQSETPAIDRANFRDIYTRRAERERKKAQLTPTNRKLLEEVKCIGLPK